MMMRVLALLLLLALPSVMSQRTDVKDLFSAVQGNAQQVADEILRNANDQILSFQEKENALRVAMADIRLPLIQQFQAQGRSAPAPAAAAAAAGGKGPAPTKKPEGVQKTMDQAIADLQKTPMDRDLAYYVGQCNRDPSSRIDCDPNFRRMAKEDLAALLEAKALGIKLIMPFVVSGGHGDYDVSDPFDIAPSGLRKQLENLKLDKASGDTTDPAQIAAAKAAADAAAVAKAAADAKAAEDKRIADAAAVKAAADKAAADAAAAGADAAAAKAAADKAAADLAAQQEAANKAAADKAAADKAAADKAAADKAAADQAALDALPRIKRVGGLLQAPNGRTLYFMNGETPQGIMCTGPCRPFWPLATSTWRIDASAGCTGGSFTRTDGDRQLQCGNRPLYLFRDDTGPGQTGGASFNPDFQPA